MFIQQSELKLHQDNNQNMRELLLKNNFDFTEYQNSLQVIFLMFASLHYLSTT